MIIFSRMHSFKQKKSDIHYSCNTDRIEPRVKDGDYHHTATGEDMAICRNITIPA